MTSESDEDIEERFELAASYIQSNAQSFEKDQLLLFYGFYKQSTVGKCNTCKPSWYEMEAKAKWNAWNLVGDMSQTDAMKEYVKLLSSLRSGWEESESSGSKDKPRWVSVSCMAPVDECINQDDKTPFDWVKDGDVEMLKKTIDKSAINNLDDSGMGLIHWASDRGNLSTVKTLLDLSADVNLLDEGGQTALHYASACGHADTVKLLLEYGALPSVKCSEGLSPGDVALTEDIRTLITQCL